MTDLDCLQELCEIVHLFSPISDVETKTQVKAYAQSEDVTDQREDFSIGLLYSQAVLSMAGCASQGAHSSTSPIPGPQQWSGLATTFHSKVWSFLRVL